MSLLANLIRPWLNPGAAAPDPEHSEPLARVERALESVPRERAELLAAYALLLGRVAHVDDQVSAEERARLETILAQDLGLPADQATAVAELALEREACFGTDYHLVMRRVSERATAGERVSLVRALFHLASVGDISDQESEEIRRIASGLGLGQRDFVALRSEFRDFLALLKFPSP